MTTEAITLPESNQPIELEVVPYVASERKLAVARITRTLVEMFETPPQIVKELLLFLHGDQARVDQIFAEIETVKAWEGSAFKKTPIPIALRWQVWERDNFTCIYCGSRSHLSTDHKTPESKGGKTDPSNLITACASCNSRKGTMSYGDYTLKILCEKMDYVFAQAKETLSAPDLAKFKLHVEVSLRKLRP